MGKHLFILSLFAAAFSCGESARAASFFAPDVIVGKAMEASLGVTGSTELAPSYAPSLRRELYPRANRLWNDLQRYSRWNFRFPSLRIRIIRGIAHEPNAYSVGPAIYISEDIFDLLDDRQLLAVMAHEIGHSERAHFLKRMSFPLASTFLTLGQALMRPAELAELLRKNGLWKEIQNTLESASGGQEMEADCMAFRWLRRMQRAGYNVEPQDLNSATEKILGLDPLTLYPEDSPYTRAFAIQQNLYDNETCNLSGWAWK